METITHVKSLRGGRSARFPASAVTLEYARLLDAQDQLSHLRDEFILPTKASLQKTSLDGTIPGEANGGNDTKPAIYLCSNSLGLQPKAVKQHIDAQLEIWASITVNGHTRTLDDSPIVAWQDLAEACAKMNAPIVGALPSEVAIMNTLTTNIHLMLASFYKPTQNRCKVIVEWRPFPSDYHVVESQVLWHGFDPDTTIIKMQPDENSYVSTDKIIATINEHSAETAMIFLPGVQYYSGQLFDIPRITKHAQSNGIVVGWDLAHAAANVELRLHDWNVDWAVWCTYKYQNAGAGSIAAAFVHERHGKVDATNPSKPAFRPRLRGWYGGVQSLRLNMDIDLFLPTEGAAGFQLSNPSAIDLSCVQGALSVFQKTDMSALRSKSLLLTAYAEHLLDELLEGQDWPSGYGRPFRIITPRSPLERGAQLSILVRAELLDRVAQTLWDAGIVCDKRKPGVIRLTPVPMYSTFQDVWEFVNVFKGAILGLAAR